MFPSEERRKEFFRSNDLQMLADKMPAFGSGRKGKQAKPPQQPVAGGADRTVEHVSEPNFDNFKSDEVRAERPRENDNSGAGELDIDEDGGLDEDDNKQRLSVWLSQVESGTVTEEKIKEAEELRPSIVLEDALWKNRFRGIWRYELVKIAHD